MVRFDDIVPASIIKFEKSGLPNSISRGVILPVLNRQTISTGVFPPKVTAQNTLTLVAFSTAGKSTVSPLVVTGGSVDGIVT